MLMFPSGVPTTTAGSDGHALVYAKPSWDGRKPRGSGIAPSSPAGAAPRANGRPPRRRTNAVAQLEESLPPSQPRRDAVARGDAPPRPGERAAADFVSLCVI